MDSINGTSFSLSAFTNVLAGGGTLLAIGGVAAVILAAVYALCCRRGRVSFTRTGLTIEPSPPRADSAESAPSRVELPPLRVQDPIPTAAVPKRERRKSPKNLPVVPGDADSAVEEDSGSARH
jgi:hypothetical protein